MSDTLMLCSLLFLSVSNAITWWWVIQANKEIAVLREIKINLDGMVGSDDLIVKVIESNIRSAVESNMRVSGLGDK